MLCFGPHEGREGRPSEGGPHLSAGKLYGGIETLLTTMARLRHLAPEWSRSLDFASAANCGLNWSRQGYPFTTLAPYDSAGHGRSGGPVGGSDRYWPVRPDVVVAHAFWPHAVFAPVVRRAGVRLVHFIHGRRTAGTGWSGWRAAPCPTWSSPSSHFTAVSVRNVFPKARVESWHLPVARTCRHVRTLTGAFRAGDR